MIDPNVLNYFVVILGGFGAVWGYRHFTHQQDKKIGEFEYAAFSALCGIPIAIGLILLAFSFPGLGKIIDTAPMLFSLPLFCVGVVVGWIGARIKKGR